MLFPAPHCNPILFPLFNAYAYVINCAWICTNSKHIMQPACFEDKILIKIETTAKNIKESNQILTLIGLKLAMSPKNKDSIYMSPWKQNAQGYVAQRFFPAFWTLQAPSKKNTSVQVQMESGSNSVFSILNCCPIYSASFPLKCIWIFSVGICIIKMSVDCFVDIATLSFQK